MPRSASRGTSSRSRTVTAVLGLALLLQWILLPLHLAAHAHVLPEVARGEREHVHTHGPVAHAHHEHGDEHGERGPEGSEHEPHSVADHLTELAAPRSANDGSDPSPVLASADGLRLDPDRLPRRGIEEPAAPPRPPPRAGPASPRAPPIAC